MVWGLSSAKEYRNSKVGTFTVNLSKEAFIKINSYMAWESAALRMEMFTLGNLKMICFKV
jgi:hypothetical protein